MADGGCENREVDELMRPLLFLWELGKERREEVCESLL
jgi:hypothetical protein